MSEDKEELSDSDVTDQDEAEAEAAGKPFALCEEVDDVDISKYEGEISDKDEAKEERSGRIQIEDDLDRYEPSPPDSIEKCESEGQLASNEQGKELEPEQADPIGSNAEVSSEQFDPNEPESGVEQEEFNPNDPDGDLEPDQFKPNDDGEKYESDFDPNEPESNVEQEEFEPNDSGEEEEPDQFNPNIDGENYEGNEFDQYEIKGDDEYGENFEQEGNPENFYENFNAESMNTVLLSENLIYAYLKEYIETIGKNENEAMEQGEQAEIDNSKEEVSELEEFLNEEKERIRLEQQQAEINESTKLESEPELVVKEEEVGTQENISETATNNEEEVENHEMKHEVLSNENMESGKFEEIEEKKEEPQPNSIEEKIEEQELNLKLDKEHEIEPEPIAHEKELDVIIEEEEEEEDNEIFAEVGELSQVNQELEVINDINSNETEVWALDQEDELEQREIEELKDPQQELEEILEQNSKIEQEALIEVEIEQSDKNIEKNYENAKKLYGEETGKRAIYANKETKGFKQWLEEKQKFEENQEHSQLEEDNTEVLKERIDQEIKEEIHPNLQPLLKEIIENYNFLKQMTARFKELYKSAKNKQISKAEKNELKLLINSLKKVGPTKFMLFTSIQAIKHRSNYHDFEKFSKITHLNQALNHLLADQAKIYKKLYIKEYIKNLDWDQTSPDWIVTDKKTKSPFHLDPTKDCSLQNPLYKSQKWLDRIYNDEKLKLSDRKIGEIYNLSYRSIGNWRKRLDIQTKPDKGRYISANGYVLILMPENYHHPELIQNPKGRIRRKEHLVVMENYLKEHPESEASKRNLIDGKYLKIECEVHHINHIRNDNRLENLWLYESKSEHSRAQRSLHDCFSALYKLGQIKFNKGIYYVNYTFNYRTLEPVEIQRIIQPTEFKGDKNINEIKEKIKTYNWDEVTDDWTVWKNSNQFGEVRMTVIPYKDCSKENPLYRHKLWLETIVKEKQYNLTDPRLAKLCGISESTTYKWRWNHHRIPTYYERWGKIRTLSGSKRTGYRILIKIPNDYKNPFARKNSRQNTMLEHRYVMETYLAEHPELEISQKSLLHGKFLKTEYIVHHINLDTIDNRVENLWVCEEHTGHHSIHANLVETVHMLIKAGFLSFKKGKYYLNY